MPRVSKERWAQIQAGTYTPKQRKPIESKPQRKSKEQLAYEAENRVRAMREKRNECEVFAMLEEIGGGPWLKFKRDNRHATLLWTEFETHHIYRRKNGDWPWNMIRVLKAVHEFEKKYPPLGLLACVLVKERNGALEQEAAKAVIGGNGPVGLIYKHFGYGNFSGKAAGAAEAFIKRHKV